ncbi:hypothetical protein PR048_018940 [Dryococelus australis]|uniref:Uncharacterized protein n=1 Tax=Dryococelus australis TaxID=614101 RepID=A0ABQ9H2F4_9NEOP|nr:hypothetical protein PR048_018940 [Dryococelus australis]
MGSVSEGDGACINNVNFSLVKPYVIRVDAQGRGLLYRGVCDGFVKIWHTEGIYGFYKGFVPSYARVGPHTVLCFVFWEALKDLENKIFHAHTK